MRLDDQPESQNIEDRRGIGPGVVRVGGLGGLGIVAILVLGLLFGVDPSTLLSIVENQQPSYQEVPESGSQQAGAEDSQRRFVAQVLGSTESVWSDVFTDFGRRYEPPRLVLFSGAAESACGFAQSAMGPFYCPQDGKVYLDTAFFRDMQTKLNAPGDFPRAYVIAHEIGHHVQDLLGLLDMNRGKSNEISVRTELQADCFAGVWANRANTANHILEQGDIEAGINAASAIGDDRLQMRARGYVVPDSFTHGSSAQRVRWFQRGVQTGDPRQCDTFRVSEP
jgi:uncharacterized protein